MKRLMSVTVFGAIVLALVLGACAPAAPATQAGGAADLNTGSMEEPAAEEPAAEAPAEAGRDEAVMPPAMPTMVAPEAASGLGGGPAAEMPPVIDQEVLPSLTAGTRDDNDEFTAYLQYRYDFIQSSGTAYINDVNVSERHVIRVTTTNGLPVLGAQVLIYAGQDLVSGLRTTASGLAYFHPYAYDTQADSYTVTVSKGDASQNFTLTRSSQGGEWPVTLQTAPSSAPVKLDVLFLLDATGSMGDEIDPLKENILSIAGQIEALPARPDVRYGLVTYRDYGDEYVFRTYQGFMGDVGAFQNVIDNVSAAGGGDEPEALNEAFAAAVNDVDWRVDDTVSLVFLIADAPPHLDYPNSVSYAVTMQQAAELGIKVFPIASSNTSPYGSFIMRQIGQFTGGQFIFLTYEDTPQSSGEAGRDDVGVPEGTYSNQDLDTLVVQIISDELGQLFAQ